MRRYRRRMERNGPASRLPARPVRGHEHVERLLPAPRTLDRREQRGRRRKRLPLARRHSVRPRSIHLRAHGLARRVRPRRLRRRHGYAWPGGDGRVRDCYANGRPGLSGAHDPRRPDPRPSGQGLARRIGLRSEGQRGTGRTRRRHPRAPDIPGRRHDADQVVRTNHVRRNGPSHRGRRQAPSPPLSEPPTSPASPSESSHRSQTPSTPLPPSPARWTPTLTPPPTTRTSTNNGSKLSRRSAEYLSDILLLWQPNAPAAKL